MYQSSRTSPSSAAPSVVGHLGVAVALTGVAIVATLRTKSCAIVTAQPFIVELKQRRLASHRS